MSKKYFCDNCNREVPLADQLQPLVIGDKHIMDLCFNCASTLEQNMKKPVPAQPTQPTQPAQAAETKQPEQKAEPQPKPETKA